MNARPFRPSSRQSAPTAKFVLSYESSEITWRIIVFELTNCVSVSGNHNITYPCKKKKKKWSFSHFRSIALNVGWKIVCLLTHVQCVSKNSMSVPKNVTRFFKFWCYNLCCILWYYCTIFNIPSRNWVNTLPPSPVSTRLILKVPMLFLLIYFKSKAQLCGLSFI